MRAIVTGGLGFIGSHLCRKLVQDTGADILNIDKQTYAGNPALLQDIADQRAYRWAKTDICDADSVSNLVQDFKPDVIFHLAAESHVDRSVSGPSEFVRTNVTGTMTLLEAAYSYWTGLASDKRNAFRFLQVSTDEVYGALGSEGAFSEESPYDPSSPYSASKAGGDHLAMAWFKTYGFPVIVTHASNNYGPGQYPEKLIPVMVRNARAGKKLPIYGRGENVRDWIYVTDHIDALVEIARAGRVGEHYNIGGGEEFSNIDLVRWICSILEESGEPLPVRPVHSLISFVEDRPGHDFRYALDCNKIRAELGWTPKVSMKKGLPETLRWYGENQDLWSSV